VRQTVASLTAGWWDVKYLLIVVAEEVLVDAETSEKRVFT
jgi:hypothetical protein